MSTQQLILVGLIFFIAHLVSAVTGFGSNVLGVPLLALIVGLMPGKQAIIVLGAGLYAYMSIRWWKHVDRRELVRIILIAGIGLVVGMLIFAVLPKRASSVLLGLFVIGAGVRGLINFAKNFVVPLWLAQLALFIGGIIHGAFTIGGPIISVYARRTLHNKSTFRATLAVMWLILAIMLMTGWTVSHTWDPRTLHICLIGLPCVICSTIVGEILHHRLAPQAFQKLVSVILVLVGIVLLISAMK